LGKLIYGGSKVIDLSLKHYKMFLSNRIWYMDDIGVKMHRIILKGDKKINMTLTTKY
jgi:hypothetical protein